MTTHTKMPPIKSGRFRVMTAMVRDNGELFKQFMDNEDFRNWMLRVVFDLTYLKEQASA